MLVRPAGGAARGRTADTNTKASASHGTPFDVEEEEGDAAREDELECLIAQVREARERLATLIGTIKAGRPDWEERAQRWARWRTEALRRPPYDPQGPKIH